MGAVLDRGAFECGSKLVVGEIRNYGNGEGGRMCLLSSVHVAG